MTISALILAAGQSKRMGQPKMLLPWGKTSVLGQVIETIQRAGVEEIIVVTGGAREQVEGIVTSCGLQVAHNNNFASGEMLSSIQVGLRALMLPPPSLRDTSPREASLRDKSAQSNLDNNLPLLGGFGGGREGVATLIVLGDQPQTQEGTVRAVVRRFIGTEFRLIVPSYQMRRGHPWLVARPLWDEILQMKSPQTPRDFLNAHAHEIDYVIVDTPSVLADLDTTDDYLKSRP